MEARRFVREREADGQGDADRVSETLILEEIVGDDRMRQCAKEQIAERAESEIACCNQNLYAEASQTSRWQHQRNPPTIARRSRFGKC